MAARSNPPDERCPALAYTWRVFGFLSQMAQLLLLPVNLAFWLICAAIVLLLLRKWRVAGKVLLAAAALVWVSALPLVGFGLLGALENPYRLVEGSETPSADCAVVLGGMVSKISENGENVVFNDAVARYEKALEIMRQGGARLLIVSSGGLPTGSAGLTEAEIVRNLLVAQGIDARRLIAETRSRNTRENALYSAEILAAEGCDAPLLITSALHMPRAEAAFRRVGVAVVPVATGFQSRPSDGWGLASLVPSLEALKATQSALREWMGRLAYWARGWN